MVTVRMAFDRVTAENLRENYDNLMLTKPCWCSMLVKWVWTKRYILFQPSYSYRRQWVLNVILQDVQYMGEVDGHVASAEKRLAERKSWMNWSWSKPSDFLLTIYFCFRIFADQVHAPNSIELFYDLLLGTALGSSSNFMLNFKEDNTLKSSDREDFFRASGIALCAYISYMLLWHAMTHWCNRFFQPHRWLCRVVVLINMLLICMIIREYQASWP